MKNNIELTNEFIYSELEGLCSAHDIYHINRVYMVSKKIFLEDEIWDEEVILISSLLHEMMDDKFFKWVIDIQKIKVEKFLDTLTLTLEQKEKIIYIIEHIWFWKSLGLDICDKFIEFQIVEDADRLEAIWAIAIARTFAYWWKKKRPIYDPNIEVKLNMTQEEYINYEWTSLNHFYEKLLKLKDLMNTKLWKKMADERHKFMETFLEQFLLEWEWII